MKNKLRKLLLPISVIIACIILFYSPFFFQSKLPIPSDILTGVYFPWLDLKFDNFPAGVPVKNNIPSDIVSLTYPLRKVSMDIIKRGRLPLWNPYILSGTPLLTNFQSAAFYPLNILYLLFNNFSLVWSVQVILQPLLSYIFMYLFLKNNKLKTLSAIAGSIVWAFGGFFSLWQQHNTVIHCIVYLPLILFAIGKISSKKLWPGLLMAISVASSIYAGNPPVSLIVFVLAGFYSLYKYLTKPKQIAIIFLWSLLGIVLSSPVLVPSLKSIDQTVRPFDNVVEAGNIKYLKPHKLLTIISPNFFGNPTTGNYWETNSAYDNLTIYFGILPLIALLYLLQSKSDPLVKFCQIGFFVSLFLFLPNPFSKFIGQLPILGLSSMTLTRFSLASTFFMAVLTAKFFDQLINNKINIKKLLIASLVPFVILSLCLFNLYQFDKSSNSFFPVGKLIKSNQTDFLKVSARNSVVPVFLIFSVSLLISIKRVVNKNIIIYSLILLTTLDLFYFFKKYNSFTDPDFIYPDTPVTDYLKTNSTRFLAEPAEIMPPNTWLAYQISSPNGQDTLTSKRYSQFVSLINGGSLADVGNRFTQIRNLTSPLLDFLGIDHFVAIKRQKGVPDSQGEINHQLKDYPQAFSSNRVSVVKNEDSFPPIFSVTNYEISKDIQQTESLLLTKDLSSTVIVEKDMSISSHQISKCLIGNYNQSDNTVDFDTTSDKYCLLVHPQTYHPNWKLSVDDKASQDIFIANHAFIGLLIPPGQHFVKLQFSLW